MARLQPSTPGFEPKKRPAPKGGKSPAPKAKVIKAPKEVVTPRPIIRLTAGPYRDDGVKWNHPAWTVITRQGDIVQYHRFKNEDEAKEFASSLSTPNP
ncbi:MAG TPA: hypothetical protein VFI41_05280 [Gemmatimonadales bacterium]|nr:hypothetical protein [Gemmatimonadales bacterium]